MKVHSTPAWQAWSGYAFENLCLKHVPQIKQALGIGGVWTGISTDSQRDPERPDSRDI